MRRVAHILALALIVSMAMPSAVLAALKTQTIDYRVGDAPFTGYLAYDDAITGKRPGVLVVHEWWGLNDYTRRRTEMLAGLGYTAFAVDMYGAGKTADHPGDAGGMANAIRGDMTEAERRFDAAMALLRQQPTVDPERIAALGYCFGGMIVLHMARTGADLDGVVSYHGPLKASQPAQPGAVKAEVLVFTGAADPMIPAAQVQAFEDEMRNAGARFEVISYPGAKHAFTNPEADANASRFNVAAWGYDKAADEDSWQKTKAFLARIFQESGRAQ